MKITKKIALVTASAAFISAAAFAQDATVSAGDSAESAVASTDDFSGFGDGGFGGFGGDDFGSESAEPALTFSGIAETSARFFPRRTDDAFNTFNYDTGVKDFKDKATSADATFVLGAKYEGTYSDFEAKLKFNKGILEDNPEDVLQEFTARAYLGSLQLEAGKMKLVWGKGDKVHVLDNFNSNDYTDFIVPDYIDRRLALPMFHAVYNGAMRTELVVTPWMTPDRLATSGMWQPAATAKLTNYAQEILFAQNNNMASAQDLYNISQFDSDSLYPNTHTLKYAQGGLRSTFTLGSVDLGVSYYLGRYKQPTANLEHLIGYMGLAKGEIQTQAFAKYKAGVVAQVKAYMSDPAYATYAAALADKSDEEIYQYVCANQTTLSTVLGKTLTVYDEDQVKAAVKSSMESNGYTVDNAMPSLNYDQLQVFGLEAATVIGPFNTRAELAYNLTKDIAGDDPWVKNNSIAWEAGFDINVPIHNVNLNFQTTGKYILHKDKIEDGAFKAGELAGTAIMIPTKEYDTDYDSTGKYYRNQLIVDITDTFNYEKIKLDVKGIYQIETKDLMVLPTLNFRLGGDDFTLSLSGLVIWCYDEDSEYYAWRNNDFASVGIKYQF